MQFKYRITKYDPKNRNNKGHYTLDDWTSFADIGKTFGTSIFSEQEYLKVENAYVSSALAFLQESGINQLTLLNVENHKKTQVSTIDIQKGSVCNLTSAETLFKMVLREQFWCKFEWQSDAYLHFGWDYYMYIGVKNSCMKSISFAEGLGLFVEPYVSPYLKIR